MTRSGGNPEDLLHVIGHQVKWVGDHNHYGVWCMVFDARSNLGHDVRVLSNQILTGHARHARKNRSHYHNVGSGDVVVVSRAGYGAVVIQHVGVLRHVRELCLWQTLHKCREGQRQATFIWAKTKAHVAPTFPCSNHCNFSSSACHGFHLSKGT